MTPIVIKKYNGKLAIGDTLVIPYVLRVNNVLVDITNYTFTTFITTDLDPSVPAALTVVTTVHADPTNGRTEIVFTSAETRTLLEGMYYIVVKYEPTPGELKTPVGIEVNFIYAGEYP